MSGGRRLWRAAAAALLAIGAVVGVRLLSAPSSEGGDGISATHQQDPVDHVVDDPEDVDALPVDARSVVVRRQGDDVLERIARRCPKLRRLVVNCMEEFERQPTDRVFAIAATLPDLRELQLMKTVRIDGTGVEELLALPLLETLALALTRLEPEFFAVLPRMPSLRVLDLSYCRGVDDDALREVARCPGLRQLGIPGCKDVTAEGLRHLGALTTLEVLEARQLPCALDELPIERLERLVTADLADARFAKAWLRRLPSSLRKLTLGQTPLDDDGCELIAQRLPELRELGLWGTDVGDRGVAALLRLAELRKLGLSSCDAVTAASLGALAQHPRLVAVELPAARWVTVEAARPLFERGIAVATGVPAQDHLLEPLRRRHADEIAARARAGRADAR